MTTSTEQSGRAGRAAHRLGWLGLGLGIAQVAAPRVVAKLFGIKPSRDNRARIRAAGALASVAGLALVDRRVARASRVVKSVTIRCSPEDAYRFWRDLDNLPRFVDHICSVEKIDERHSRWVMSGPGGVEVTWQVEITEDRPNELIDWQAATSERKMLGHGGRVTFTRAPRNRGTEVRLTIWHARPASLFGQALTRVADVGIEQQVESDLRRFKQLLETGEIVQSDASIHRGPHPAQPPRELSRSELTRGAR
jgi:uncharacterized membrane protein